MTFPKLELLWCNNNALKYLPHNFIFPKLKHLVCSNNELMSLPESMNFPNLTQLWCDNNLLTSISKSMDLPKIKCLNFNNNQLISFPKSLMRPKRELKFDFYYENNPICLTFDLLKLWNITEAGNISCQASIRNSVNKIMTRTDVPEFNKNVLLNLVKNDDILTCKDRLLEYIEDNSEHSLLLPTFNNILWFVLHTIHKDFVDIVQKEIKTVLNKTMNEHMCKCFIGRIICLIICLV